MLNALTRSTAWRRNWLLHLRRAQNEWGETRLWTVPVLAELEVVAIENGFWTASSFRNWLTSDEGRLVRETLDLLTDRMPRRDGVTNSLNVPSVATLSRYRNLVGWDERAQLARLTFEQLVQDGVELLVSRGYDLVFYMDSYDVFITGRPASEKNEDASSTSQKRRRFVEGAGRVGRRARGKPAGAGFKIHDVVCTLGLPLVLAVSAIQVHDKRVALDELLPKLVGPLSGCEKRVRVVVADAAYYGADLLKAMLRSGFVPCIHESSHGVSERTKKDVARKDVDWRNIEYKGEPSGWWANGHFEFFCECGNGRTVGRVSVGKSGRARVRTELECENCGHISITAGMWRKVDNPRCYRREWIDVPYADQRPALGNPLTYHSRRARAYGEDRFGYQESFHGQLQRAYNLGGWDNRRPIESQAHLEYVLYTIAGLMWANAIERLREAEQARRG